MNALTIFVLLLTVNTCISSDRVEKKAQHANKANDFFSTHLEVQRKQIIITSYFDLTPHKSVIEKTLNTSSNTYDVRPLEVLYCRLSQATMAPHRLHRGKLGFVTGIALTAAALEAKKYVDNRISEHSEKE